MEGPWGRLRRRSSSVQSQGPTLHAALPKYHGFFVMNEVDLSERFRSGVRRISHDVVFGDMGIIRLQRRRYGGHSLSIVHEAHLYLRTCTLPPYVVLARFQLAAANLYGI